MNTSALLVPAGVVANQLAQALVTASNLSLPLRTYASVASMPLRIAGFFFLRGRAPPHLRKPTGLC